MENPKIGPALYARPPFNRKVNKLEIIEALIRECLTLEEDVIIEDDTENEDMIEEETSI